MATLDSRLKTAENWAQLIGKYVKKPNSKGPMAKADSPAA
jgi:hypothetical protein